MSVAWAVLIFAVPGQAAAQALSGRVVDAMTRTPVVGAFIELLAADGRRASATLADSSGAFRFSRVQPGGVVRVRMLGYEEQTAAPRSLDEVILLNPSAIPIAAMTVEGTRRCGGPAAEAKTVFAIWSEARRALSVIDWVMAQPSVAFVTTTRESLRRFAGDDLVSSSEEGDTVTARPPFRTVTPAEARDVGLVRGTLESSMEFLAPGPDYLLSSEFAERHCFSAARSRGRVGLRFVVRTENRLPDIEGTLWLDETTSALSSLDFHYTGIETPLRTQAGGALAFAHTVEGLWYIRSWKLSAPLVTQQALRPGASERWIARNTFIKERTGEVKQVIWRGEPRD